MSHPGYQLVKYVNYIIMKIFFVGNSLLQIWNAGFNEPSIAEIQMAASVSIEFELTVFFHFLNSDLYVLKDLRILKNSDLEWKLIFGVNIKFLHWHNCITASIWMKTKMCSFFWNYCDVLFSHTHY